MLKLKLGPPKTKLVGLVRDAQGRPKLDRPIWEYEPAIREALLSMMSEEEKEAARNGAYVVRGC